MKRLFVNRDYGCAFLVALDYNADVLIHGSTNKSCEEKVVHSAEEAACS